MPVEASHVQLIEYKKEAIPYVNWMMEDLFCRYGVSIPYFLLDFSFPDYSARPDWVSPYIPELPEFYFPSITCAWPQWLPTNGFNFGSDWGKWEYYLPWFNELLGLLFDEADLPRWQLPDFSPESIAMLNERLSALYDAVEKVFTATKRTDTAYDDKWPELDVSGTKIYYIWWVDDYADYRYRIWTGVMNTDGTSFSSAERRAAGLMAYPARLQVSGTKIYYVWIEKEEGGYQQVFTGSMNTDGTSWSATQRTTDDGNKIQVTMQVSESTIYYAWVLSGTPNSVWTASMSTGGSGWSASERRDDAPSAGRIYFKVVGTKIYYVWREVNTNNEIWTAVMNTNGTGWVATERRSTAYVIDYNSPILDVSGDTIYYTWQEKDANGKYQLWTATMGTDGSGWSATQRTNDTTIHSYPTEMQIVSDKIYYVSYRRDGTEYRQIWTASMNTDGTGWAITQRTTSLFHKYYPQLEMLGSSIYYVWFGLDSDSKRQIWTAVLE